ncbi:MAG: threonine synthase [Chloroflexi bacterium]|nr:MAG: threonine synthase [Chloroflexota bacterium]MBA4375618.1 threonine synthase [Anaerolinea sp.]
MKPLVSNRYRLVCPVCGSQFDPTIVQTYCSSCNSPILTEYDLGSLGKILEPETVAERPRGIWRWRELLPINEEKNCLTLGEGDTPLLQLNNLGVRLGFPNLFVKDESTNATGTFKARGMVVAISKAIELGIREFVIPTAGNAGGALAAYAASAGCKAHIYMPEDTPKAIKIEVQMMGADLHLIKGLLTDAANAAHANAVNNGWFDVSTFKEPFRVEGKKTMGFELAQAFQWDLPDVIIYPTGGGTGLVGMWKAFAELETLGWISYKRPRMVSVQAEGCAPVVKAFQKGAERTEVWQNATTIASGLRVPSVFADRLILKALRESNGTALTVSDSEILSAQKEFAAQEGIFAAPEGAATLACLKKLKHQGWLQKNNRIVLFNTGTGLKYI